jgi:putative transposase
LRVQSSTDPGLAPGGKARRLMSKNTAGVRVESTVGWAGLEGFVRGKVQELIQAVLEEEVTELLGRRKSERRTGVDAEVGYRNGHGKPRRLATRIGTVVVRRPRVRGLEERFESRVLPLFARRTKEVGVLLPELYLHGLAEGDFELALRGLLGDGAPLSKASIQRLREVWKAEHESWSRRSLEGHEVVYVWADGIYVKAGLERDKAALLVVIGARRDGTKEILAVTSGYRESTESWVAVFRDLKARGIDGPRVLAADGNPAIWAAGSQVWPEAAEQRCWNHKILNVLDRLPKREHREAKELLRAVAYAPTRAKAVAARKAFAKRFGPWYPKAVEVLEDDWERMVAFYDFPEEHWKHLRTTNVIESPFASVRLRTTAAKRFKRVDSATALIWKLLTVAEKRFRKLNAPHLLRDVFDRRKFEDGKPVLSNQRKVAA